MSKISVTNVYETLDKQNKNRPAENNTFKGVDMVNGLIVRDLEEFKTKDELETYGLKFGIDLNKRFSLENMRTQLSEHIDSLR